MSDSKWFLLIIVIVVVMFGCMAFFFMGNNLNSNYNSKNIGGVNGAAVAVMNNGIQEITLTALDTGQYDKRVIEVKSGVPVRLKFSADDNSGCGRQLIIPDFGVKTVVNSGEVQNIDFTPTTPGEYPYRCGMNMFRGKLIVQ